MHTHIWAGNELLYYTIDLLPPRHWCKSTETRNNDYDTQTYFLERVFTFQNHPFLIFSRRPRPPHALSSAEACRVLFGCEDHLQDPLPTLRSYTLHSSHAQLDCWRVFHRWKRQAILFQMCWLHDNAQVKSFHLAVTDSVLTFLPRWAITRTIKYYDWRLVESDVGHLCASGLENISFSIAIRKNSRHHHSYLSSTCSVENFESWMTWSSRWTTHHKSYTTAAQLAKHLCSCKVYQGSFRNGQRTS